MATFQRLLAVSIACGLASTGALASGAPSGIDLKGIDHSVQPGNDFDGYANGA